MISALIFALAAGQLLPKDPPIRPRVFRSDGAERVSRLGSDDFAFFEAFPASGTGTNGACSTTPPTGAKGEALTFTRGSTATCTKTATGGLATTGIANGDLVVMASNQPRVEYDSAGVLGLLVESSRTNSLLRSQEIDNAVWSKSATGGGSIPTVTADFGIAPDGTTTAERVQFSACATVGDSSTISQAAIAQAGAGSFLIKGNGTTGNLRLVAFSGGGPGQDVTTLCSFVSGSWTRCINTNSSAGAATVVLGCINQTANYGGASNTGAADVLVWGGQWEAGAYATSYIPTTSAAVTRSADSAYFPVSLNTAAGFSHAHTFTLQSTTNFTGAMGLYQDALNRTQLYQFSGNALNADIFTTSGSRSAAAVPGVWATNTAYRIGHSYSGSGASSTVSVFLGGAVQNTSAAGVTSAYTATQFGLGLNSPWNTGEAIYSRLCLDPNPTRCR
jgi:hypothetical protein